MKIKNSVKCDSLWKGLLLATDKFKKGNYVLTTKEMRIQLSEDPYLKFRTDLEIEYDWLHSQLCIQYDDLLEQLKQMEINDPSGKTVFSHNLKPSDENEKIGRLIDKHNFQLKKIENVFIEIIEKISCWNTYFGEKKILKSEVKIMEHEVEIGNNKNDLEDDKEELQMMKKRILTKPSELKKKKI